MFHRIASLVLLGLSFTLSARAQCLETELRALDATAGDRFGGAIDVSSSRAIIGVRFSDGAGASAGSAYTFVRQGTAWVQEAKLTAQDAAAGDFFGVSVAIDGSIAVVGADLDDDLGNASGAAYVFENAGGMWIQSAKLTASDGAAGRRFGTSVAVSGTRIVVGSLDEEAYVFERQGFAWVETAELLPSAGGPDDLFGRSVDIFGTTIFVGAQGYDGVAKDAGRLFVFERTLGGNWAERVVTPAIQSAGDAFGFNVAVEGDRGVVAAWGDDEQGMDAGSAWLLEKVGGAWTATTKLTASDGSAGDRFGSAVALSGEHVVVGASFRDDGAGGAYVFERVAGEWVQVDVLALPARVSGDELGTAVGISTDFAVAGAWGVDAVGADAGAVYAFHPFGCGPGQPTCFGIGCPCGNDDPDAGCVNSTGSGAYLRGTGSASVAADDLVLVTSGCPAGNPAVYFAGDTLFAAAPFLLGDGLACVGGSSFRFVAGLVDPTGLFTLDHPVRRAPADLVAPGNTVHFQVWMRDVFCGPPPVPCPSPCGKRTNLSNAYSVSFLP